MSLSKFIFKIILAFEIHNIECDSTEIVVEFYDNNNAPMAEIDLLDIISQKFNSGCFFVEIKILSDHYKEIKSAVSEIRVCLMKCRFNLYHGFRNFNIF